MTAQEKTRILVVEDELHIREGLVDVLTFHGYDVVGVETGEAGLEEALGGRFALILLDVMLPGMDGFSVCKKIREELDEQAILMLTAKGSEDDILTGFENGADDYVTKPFSVRQLVARVGAILRRVSHTQKDESYDFGYWQIDPRTATATQGQQTNELSRRELDLLAVLAREKGRIVSRRRLLREVWGFGNPDDIETRTVDVHIAKLRKKLNDNSAVLIQTVRGQGYRFAP